MSGPRALEKGRVLPPLRKERLTSAHIARWCAAQQNWDKIHYDLAYAREVAKLPGTIINGALKQHLITQFLDEAFEGKAWPWRLDYRFSAMDFVGEELEVRGTITEVRPYHDWLFVTVEASIWNLDQNKATTEGTAIVVCRPDGNVGPAAQLEADTPQELRLDRSIKVDDRTAPDSVRTRLAARLELVESDYAIDLSRLRLFAEAVGGLRPLYFDPASPQAKAAGGVLAPPLFPLHALESMPGRRLLSLDPEAMGREGVNEIGRDMRRLFGFEIAWNGGDRVEIQSLARAGERVAAESVLVGAFARDGKRGGRMLFFETLNRYSVVNGRELLTERQTMVCQIKEMSEE
ncbi:MAG: MaoC family dehydratase N-terminal domain-containing protein [Betaproteobacteria bacterium]